MKQRKVCVYCNHRQRNGEWQFRKGLSIFGGPSLSTLPIDTNDPDFVWEPCRFCGGTAFREYDDPPQTLLDWLLLTDNETWIPISKKLARHLGWRVIEWTKSWCRITSSRSVHTKTVEPRAYGWSDSEEYLAVITD